MVDGVDKNDAAVEMSCREGDQALATTTGAAGAWGGWLLRGQTDNDLDGRLGPEKSPPSYKHAARQPPGPLPSPPPETTKLLHEVVDQLVVEAPAETWIEIVEVPPEASFNSDEGEEPINIGLGEAACRVITFSMLANYVNGMARWIHDHCQNLPFGEWNAPFNPEPVVVAFTSPHDMRYPIVMLALMKLGKTPVLCPWPDSLDAHWALFEAANSRILLQDGDIISFEPPNMTPHPPMYRVCVPDDLETLPCWEAGHIPERPPIDDAHTVMVLQTALTSSASPTSVHIPASAFHALRTIPSIPTPPGRQSNVGQLCNTALLVSPLPLFSMSGIELLCRTIYHRRPILLLNSSSPASAESVLAAIAISKATSLVAPPSILQEICRVPDDLHALAKLDCVFSDGALLDERCGNTISAYTRLHNGMGTTETGRIPSLVPLDPKDWSCLEPISESGVVMLRTPFDKGLARMLVHPHPSPEVARDYQLVFHINPTPEWQTGSLFSPHPYKLGLWRYAGRMDDMIVLSDGKIIDPTLLERTGERCPFVRGASVFGTGHSHAGLLIELVEPATAECMASATTKRARIASHAWTHVKDANQHSPFHAEVWESMILFANPGKPFKRDAQGAVARRLTEEAFQDEISELYRIVDQGPAATNYSAAEMELDLKDRVHTAVSSVFQLDDIPADKNFFRLPGADSLRILALSHTLSKQIGIRISAQQLYQHSTVQRLTRALVSVLCNKDRSHLAALAAQNGPCPVVDISREQYMSAMIHEGTQSAISSLNGEIWLPPQSGNQPTGNPSKYTVLLVGSTGLLGSHLLDALLHERRVECIWCLNQSFDAAQEQEELFVRLGFDTRDELAGDRVEFVTSLDLGASQLGICEESGYAELTQIVDVIIHNAWPVNFTMPLPFFDDSIKGVVALAELAVRSGSTMIFVSSVASCMNYAAIRRRPLGSGPKVVVPETFEPDHSMPAKQGYGESIHVAECILADVAKRYAVQTFILRMMGMVPLSLPPPYNIVDWVPINSAAAYIAKVSARAVTRTPWPVNCLSVLHIVNSMPAPWSIIAKAVQEVVGNDKIRGVKYEDWLEQLQIQSHNAPDTSIMDTHPAVRLLELFEEMGARDRAEEPVLEFSNRNAKKMVPLLSRIPAVGEILAQA
ncbi:hypothetical protein B0T18DRAFT_394072 [Schizothecium vesticola]|uniref:Carrier domain-containing protein n=1 Tax=Schizothecium vesticola TaxID=314040 RepID=A0AA40ELI1_9PEZI|nr:hypothetical protein B0T18DRAFT_394072 [Schizothecium vesticola]